MKFLLTLLVLGQLSVVCFGAVKHKFVAIDNKKGNIYYVNEFKPSESWKIKSPPKARSIQLLDKDTILVNSKTGALTYNLSTGKKTGWEIDNQKNVICAGKMPNGNYYFGCGWKIAITDKDGNKVKDIVLPKDPKPLMRLVEYTKKNTFMYAGKGPFCALEVDMDGEIVSKTKTPGKGYKHQRLKNGNLLHSQGPQNRVIETTSKGKIVREFGGKECLKKFQLDFCSGWSLLKNGNVVITNWLGHKKYEVKSKAHLIELNKKNKIIWTWDKPEAWGVTNVMVIK